MINLTKDELKALLTFASKDITRPNLNAIGVVKLNDGRHHLCTTNGHALVCLRLATMDEDESTLNQSYARQGFDAALKLMKKNDVAQVHLDDMRIVVDGQSIGLRVEGTFPSVESLCTYSAPDKPYPFSFDSKYIKALDEVKKAADTFPVFHLNTNSMAPIMFTFPGTGWSGLIMPCRTDSKHDGYTGPFDASLASAQQPEDDEPEDDEPEDDVPPPLSDDELAGIAKHLKNNDLIEEVNAACGNDDATAGDWLLTYFSRAEDDEVEDAIDLACEEEVIFPKLRREWLDYLNECAV